MKLSFGLSLVLCLSIIVLGKSEAVEEEDTKISPQETRELLIAALKIISKDRANRIKQQTNPAKNVIFADNQATLALKPVPVPLSSAQVAIISTPISDDADSENDEIAGETKVSRGDFRRYLRVATNPYTGVLHYVNYPVYYPVYG